MKIIIKDKSFNTTHYGTLEAGKEYDVPDEFGKYCVEKMKSADRVEPQKRRTKKRSTE